MNLDHRDPRLASVPSASSVVRSSPKIVTPEFMAEERRALTFAGQTLAFTNGCFDLLHTGHLASLRFARSQADALCVAVNTDASIRRLKGPARPIIPEDQRVALLAALDCVDYVVTFDTDTPREIIAQILPDVLVKGDDHRFTTIAGAVEVIAAGGRVEFCPREHNTPSTSAIIAKIKSSPSAPSASSVVKSLESSCAA